MSRVDGGSGTEVLIATSSHQVVPGLLQTLRWSSTAAAPGGAIADVESCVQEVVPGGNELEGVCDMK